MNWPGRTFFMPNKNIIIFFDILFLKAYISKNIWYYIFKGKKIPQQLKMEKIKMTNINYTELKKLGVEPIYKSNRNGKGRLYATDMKTGARLENSEGFIFEEYYDNNGISKNPVTARTDSHIWIATENLLAKVKAHLAA